MHFPAWTWWKLSHGGSYHQHSLPSSLWRQACNVSTCLWRWYTSVFRETTCVCDRFQFPPKQRAWPDAQSTELHPRPLTPVRLSGAARFVVVVVAFKDFFFYPSVNFQCRLTYGVSYSPRVKSHTLTSASMFLKKILRFCRHIIHCLDTKIQLTSASMFEKQRQNRNPKILHIYHCLDTRKSSTHHVNPWRRNVAAQVASCIEKRSHTQFVPWKTSTQLSPYKEGRRRRRNLVSPVAISGTGFTMPYPNVARRVSLMVGRRGACSRRLKANARKPA